MKIVRKMLRVFLICTFVCVSAGLAACDDHDSEMLSEKSEATVSKIA